MIDKIILGLAILLCSNLVVGSLSLNTQTIVLGTHTSVIVLTTVCIVGGFFLGISIRGLLEGKTDSQDDEQW